MNLPTEPEQLVKCAGPSCQFASHCKVHCYVRDMDSASLGPTSSEAVSKIAQPEGVVSFPYWPIATAPKDREIMLYVPTHYAKWVMGKWDDQRHGRKPAPFWNYGEYNTTTMRGNQPTHWAEISDMVPNQQLGNTQSGDKPGDLSQTEEFFSSPVKGEEK